jgi:hypothetical protein
MTELRRTPTLESIEDTVVNVSHSAHFSAVAVVESLAESDLKTGRQLHDDVAVQNAFHQHGLHVQFYKAPTSALFMSALQDIAKDAQAGTWPILHLECHGNESGVGLGDGSFLTWQQLKGPITSINVETRLNLLVVLAACRGGYFGSAISTTDRAPCWAIVGPTEEITSGEVLRSFGAFYSELLSTLSGDESLRALRRVALNQGDFFFTTAIDLFRATWIKFLQTYGTSSALDDWADDLHQRALEMGRSGDRAEVRRRLGDWPSHFRKYWSTFFMVDLFPENGERFAMDHEDLRDLSPSA